MAKTYYAKCGKTFSKNSTAGVTRYEDHDDKCKECLYIEQGSTYRAGKSVTITFCQTGSKKPCHKNDYHTTCEEDATTLSIHSLDMEFLKTAYDFACSQPGRFGSREWPNVFHGLDMEDCRKSMPLHFENNKKGKAAKKAIINKFFKELQQEKFDNCNKCSDCNGYLPEEGEEYGRCATRKSIVSREQLACDKFNAKLICGQGDCPFHSADESTCLYEPCRPEEEENEYNKDIIKAIEKHGCQLPEVKSIYENISKDSKCCPFYISHKEDQAFIQCRDTINVHHADWIRPRDNGELHNRYYHYTCCGTYWACALYAEQKGEREPTCNTCPNGESVEGSRGGRVKCLITGEELKGHNPDTVCEWHNKLYKVQEDISSIKQKENPEMCNSCTNEYDGDCLPPSSQDKCIGYDNDPGLQIKRPRSIVGGVCEEMREDCICFCQHNDGCSVRLITGETLTEYIKHIEEKGGINCDIYRTIRDKELKPVSLQNDNMIQLPVHLPQDLEDNLAYIRKKSEDIVGNYVEIGFTLINIKDSKLFRDRGYDNLIDCVEAELNMKKSTAYNLIKVAEKFGDSETKRLKPEYSKFNYVQCLEMSTMTKEELTQASPDMSKREMHQLKNSSRLEKPIENNFPGAVELQPAHILDKPADGSIIDVTDYKYVNDIPKNDSYADVTGQFKSDAEERSQVEQSTTFHCNDMNLPAGNLEEETNKLLKTLYPEESNDTEYTNTLLQENENYRLRIEGLEKDREIFRELVAQIDSKYDKLTKKQIRNSLWDFLSTGMIMFMDE